MMRFASFVVLLVCLGTSLAARKKMHKDATRAEAWTSCTITNSKKDRTLIAVKQLKSGAGGTTYRAQDTSTHTLAIIKMFHTEGAKEVENLKAIGELTKSQEGREPQHLNMLEPGFEDQVLCCTKPCVVLRNINGKTLHELVEAGQSMPYEMLRSIIWQTFLGWVEMEKAGFCNTDQHLENVMLEKNSLRVVLIDFGFAFKSSTCNPSSNFKLPPPSPMQPPFPNLGKLLDEEAYQPEYMKMCAQVGSMSFSTSATKSLSRVVFGTESIPQSLQPVGFFALRSVEDFQSEIKQWLREEHVAVPAEAPLPNAISVEDNAVRFRVQAPVQRRPLLPQQQVKIMQPVSSPQQQVKIMQPVSSPQEHVKIIQPAPTAQWMRSSSCNTECGATHWITESGTMISLSKLPLQPWQCANCLTLERTSPPCARFPQLTHLGERAFGSACCQALTCGRIG